MKMKAGISHLRTQRPILFPWKRVLPHPPIHLPCVHGLRESALEDTSVHHPSDYVTLNVCEKFVERSAIVFENPSCKTHKEHGTILLERGRNECWMCTFLCRIDTLDRRKNRPNKFSRAGTMTTQAPLVTFHARYIDSLQDLVCQRWLYVVITIYSTFFQISTRR